MLTIKNEIISDGDSDSESSVSDDNVPLSKRWENLIAKRKWNIPSSTINFEPQVFSYTNTHTGVLHAFGVSENISPLSIFEFFFCKELVDLIAEESNKYIQQQGFSRSRFHISNEDLYCFFAIIVHMSIVRLPKLSMYWNTNPMYNFVFTRRIISKKKFFNILRFLHFASEDQNNNEDQEIQKIQPVLDILIHRFQMAYRPGQHIVIDNSLLLWKGRLSSRQYVCSKRARFGFQSFVLAESETGYIYNLKLYSGRELDRRKFTLLGKSGTIVMDLSRNLLNEGRIIYLDNWYNSPALFEKLYECKTHACGIVRMNRKGLPCDKVVKNIKNLNKKEIVVRYNKFMVFCMWKDRSPTSVLSTLHTPQLVTTEKIDCITGEYIKKPNIILDYNMHMSMVDYTEQILHEYQSHRKTLKWYKQYFFYLLEITICNSLAIWNCLHADRKTIHDVKEDILLGLMEKYHNPQEDCSQKGRRNFFHPLRLKSRCFLKKLPPTNKQIHTMKRCVWCKMKSIRKETRYYCANCDAALCAVPCFELYHTEIQ